MNSLDWRIKKLEAKVIGKLGPLHDQQSPLDQLEDIAKHYASCVEGPHRSFPRFLELYNKHKRLLVATDSLDSKKGFLGHQEIKTLTAKNISKDHYDCTVKNLQIQQEIHQR